MYYWGKYKPSPIYINTLAITIIGTDNLSENIPNNINPIVDSNSPKIRIKTEDKNYVNFPDKNETIHIITGYI